MAGEEAVQITATAAQKAMEITVELMRAIVIPTLKTAGGLAKKGVEKVAENIKEAAKSGNVSHNVLLDEAVRSGSAIISTDNLFAEDVSKIAARAKQEGIPIHRIGSGGKQSIEFRECDKTVMQNIMQEVIANNIKSNPSEYAQFSLSESNILPMKAMLEANGVECRFFSGANGKTFCSYHAYDAEKVELLKQDFKAMQAEIAAEIKAEIPENERQLEIKAQIAELENSRNTYETHNKVYAEIVNNSKEEFHDYSVDNMERVREQMPEATKVAGKAFWEKLGYTVNENAKGVEIIAPQKDENGNPVLDGNGKQSFTNITVYDISETDAFEKAFDKSAAAKELNEQIEKLRGEYNSEKTKMLNSAEKPEIKITDVNSGKTVDLSQFGGNVRQYQIVKRLQEEMGYSEAKATLAANKICDDLGLDPKEFFAHTEQLDELKSFKTNIRFESDDRLLQDISFSEVYFRGGESPHISLANGDNSVTITPDNMSPADIKAVCITQLEMSEQQADKAVEKAIKINSQIKSQYKELAVDRTTGISQQVEIDRTSKSSFALTIGATKKQYDLKDAKLSEKLQKDLGISSDKAARIIGKAQKQSSFVNNFERFAKRKSDKPKQGKELLQAEKPNSKGARK